MENIVWSVPVPGRGHSSPCVWGEHVFLTTATESPEQQQLLSIDRATGQLQWTQAVHTGGQMKMHGKNSQASSTPACDGDRVYTVFINSGALMVTAFDLQGELAWQQDAGPFRSEHGYGSSPVLYRGLLIVIADSLQGSFIAALDRETGNIIWRSARKTSGMHGSYATPIVAHVAGRDQLLVTGMSQVCSYNPASGELFWWCQGPAEVTAGTIASSDDMIFASGGYPEKELLAIRADGNGDVTDTHVAWRAQRGVTYVPSPLYNEGLLFVVSDDGIATCFQADSGEILKQRRLGGNFSSSPILAAGHLYVRSEEGKTSILKADSSLEVVAENELGDSGFASPAICNDQLFIRTLHQLYCIGAVK